MGAFAGALALSAIAFALSAPAGMATIAQPLASVTAANRCQPQVGAEGDAPFTVFYCAGDATGRRDAATASSKKFRRA